MFINRKLSCMSNIFDINYCNFTKCILCIISNYLSSVVCLKGATQLELNYTASVLISDVASLLLHDTTSWSVSKTMIESQCFTEKKCDFIIVI